MAMEAQVKHRIVGSLILLSVAVILLPFWLDGAGLNEHQQQTGYPEMPENVEFAVIEPIDDLETSEFVDLTDSSIIELSPIQDVVEPVVVVKTEKAAKAPKKQTNPLLNSEGLASGWAVQLGSFGNQDNAKRLTEKLIKANYSAYMISKGKVHKVLVGPELSRANAEKLQKALKKQFKMAGIVLDYVVETH